jgi:replicative DNA helicase
VQAAIEQIERAVEQHKIRCVAVDYAQILRGKGKTQYEQVTATSIAIKQVTAKHNLVTLLLCQLNREIEKRDKFLPKNSDIKDCGQIEQDADVIIHVVWPWKLDNAQPPNDYMFFVTKNRNRAINQRGAVKCRFEPARQRIVEEKPVHKVSYEPSFDEYNRDGEF